MARKPFKILDSATQLQVELARETLERYRGSIDSISETLKQSRDTIEKTETLLARLSSGRPEGPRG